MRSGNVSSLVLAGGGPCCSYWDADLLVCAVAESLTPKQLPCAKLCARCCGCSSERGGRDPCLGGDESEEAAVRQSGILSSL